MYIYISIPSRKRKGPGGEEKKKIGRAKETDKSLAAASMFRPLPPSVFFASFYFIWYFFFFFDFFTLPPPLAMPRPAHPVYIIVRCACVCACVRVRPRIRIGTCAKRDTAYGYRGNHRDGVRLHVTLAAHYRPSAAESGRPRAIADAADAAAAAVEKIVLNNNKQQSF